MERELAKLPETGGRTVAERRFKLQLQHDLQDTNSDIAALKRKLKFMQASFDLERIRESQKARPRRRRDVIFPS